MYKWCTYVNCRDVGHEEKRVDLIRRIDFAWAVEREEPSSKKQKKTTTSSTSKETHSSGNQPWQWQSLVENLQLAHQELSVIIDLINTVNNYSFHSQLFFRQFLTANFAFRFPIMDWELRWITKTHTCHLTAKSGQGIVLFSLVAWVGLNQETRF